LEGNQTLEDNFEIIEWDQESLLQLKELEKFKLAKSESMKYVLCANPNDDDFDDLQEYTKGCLGFGKINSKTLEQGFPLCQRCGRVTHVWGKETKQTIFVTLDNKRIQSRLKKILKNHVDDITPLHRPFAWKLSKQDKEAIVVILDYYPLVGILELALSSEGFLGIVWSNRAFEQFQNLDMGWNLISFETLLKDNESLLQSMDIAFTPRLDSNNIWEYTKRVDEFVQIPDDEGTRFEAFARDFEQELMNSSEAIKSLLLSIQKSKPFSWWTVTLGGPGKTDLIRIDLYQYLSDFFKLIGQIECKSFRKPRFTKAMYDKALGHAELVGLSDIVFLVSTNKIEGRVWEAIERRYRSKGKYDRIMVDFELLSFLLAKLNLGHLLDRNYD